MEWEDWELRPWIWKELEGIGAQTMDLEGIGRNWSPDHGFGRNWKELGGVPAGDIPDPAHPLWDHEFMSFLWNGRIGSSDHGFGKDLEGFGAQTMDLVRIWKDLRRAGRRHTRPSSPPQGS